MLFEALTPGPASAPQLPSSTHSTAIRSEASLPPSLPPRGKAIRATSGHILNLPVLSITTATAQSEAPSSHARTAAAASWSVSLPALRLLYNPFSDDN